MAGGRGRKRVQVQSDDDVALPTSSLKRAHDGSAFTRCESCNKHVAVALMDLHDCVMEAKIHRNLDAQMAEIEATVVVDKKKTKSTEPKPKKTKKEKKAKDPNAPKRPPTAFFLFMDEFRKTHKEANPECKSVATVAKEGGEKWKSMTDEEKKVYVERAKELKADYEKAKSGIVQNENHDEAEVSPEEADAEEIVPNDD